MTLTRTALALVLALAAAPAAFAQTYSLAESPQADSLSEYRLKLVLDGEIKVRQEDKQAAFKQSVRATHAFVERVLEPGPQNCAQKVARFYREATVSIGVGDQKSDRTLRPDRCLVVAQRVGERLVTYATKPMTRDELEVTEHFDTLAITGLLPGKEVAVGATWPVANTVAQALCHFSDGLGAQDLTCKLENVKDDAAQVTFSGEAKGIEFGADVELKLQGSYQFDMKSKRITNLEWKQSETRKQGPVNPAATVELTVTLERKAIDKADEVGDFALVPFPRSPSPEKQAETLAQATQLQYSDPKGRYEFTHAREWHLVGRTEEHLNLRLIDNGAFVAQVSISQWKKAEAGKHVSGPEFEGIIAGTPNWNQEDVQESKELTGTNGNWIYHVAASGTLDDQKAIQHFYLVASPAGDQLVLAFTMTQAQAQKLSTRDVLLIRSITFPSGRVENGKKD